MYVWELVSCRLRGNGWDVWHLVESARNDGSTYRVHLRRPGFSLVASGPTLTEAYADAARQARDHDLQPPTPLGAPHFTRHRVASWN